MSAHGQSAPKPPCLLARNTYSGFPSAKRTPAGAVGNARLCAKSGTISIVPFRHVFLPKLAPL